MGAAYQIGKVCKVGNFQFVGTHIIGTMEIYKYSLCIGLIQWEHESKLGLN